jgi:hypothetical protein
MHCAAEQGADLVRRLSTCEFSRKFSIAQWVNDIGGDRRRYGLVRLRVSERIDGAEVARNLFLRWRL